MSRREPVALCDDCYDKQRPDAPSKRMGKGETELCYRCAKDTRSGLYYRLDTDAEPPCPRPAPALVSSVRITSGGAHSKLSVFVLGKLSGELVVGDDDAEPLARLLYGLDVTQARAQTELYRTLLEEVSAKVESLAAHGALGALASEALAALGAREPEWLVKDFHALYRAAKRFSEACHGRGEGGEGPYPPQTALDAQLARLAPAFQMTESVRAEGQRVSSFMAPCQKCGTLFPVFSLVSEPGSGPVCAACSRAFNGKDAPSLDAEFDAMPAVGEPYRRHFMTCLACGLSFPAEDMLTLGGGGPVCLPCADAIEEALADPNLGPTDPLALSAATRKAGEGD